MAGNPDLDFVKQDFTQKEVQTSGLVFKTFKGSDNKHYFHMVSKNGGLIAQSEGFNTKSARNDAIKMIIEQAASAIVAEREMK